MQGNQQQNGNGQQQGFNWQKIVLMLVVYYFIFGGLGGLRSNNKTTNSGTEEGGLPHKNIFASGIFMDLWIYTSEVNDSVSFSSDTLIWKEKNLAYGSWEGNIRRKSIEIIPTPTFQANGTLFAHLFFMPKGGSPDPESSDYKTPFFNTIHSLNKYVTKVTKARKNLISGEMDSEWVKRRSEEPLYSESDTLDDQSIVNVDKIEVLSHWKGNLTINIVQDFTEFPRGAIPDPIKKHMKFNEKGDYYPIVYGNDFWLLNEDLLIINDTVNVLKLDMLLEPITFWKWSLYAQMEESMRVQHSYMGAKDGESEEIKRILTDNNPYVLGMTVVISVLHSVLDILAFKNDIQFWRNKKSMEGLSIRTIYVNIICNFIVLFYLLDNDTSWMILFSVGLGCVIEVWKLNRAVHISVGYTKKYGYNIPYLIFTDKNSYVSATKEHDLTAMKYLHYASYPLVIIYAIYSLYYDSHKSWYSWIISTLAGCVYTFGFVMMTPQLFINYKLKSVAHLPWRVFVYKAISTFIDDLFAFLIRMPTMHRLRVFRDDLIFLIYLYQRWIYPVDKARIETGAAFEDVTLDEIAQAKAEAEAKTRGETVTNAKKND